MQNAVAYNYKLLGKLLVRNEPEVAYRLMAAIAATEPLDRDLTKLKDYFHSFCKLQSISPKEHTGPLYKSSKIDQRRIFICSMIQIYGPARGLTRRLSEVLLSDESHTNKLVKEVSLWYRTRQDFKTRADQAISQLTGREVE